MSRAQGHEAQRVEPVVDGHDDHLLLQPPVRPVLLGPGAASDEAPAVDEDHDGQQGVGLQHGGEDIEEETILLAEKISTDSFTELRTPDLAVSTEVQHGAPGRGGLGWHQSQGANRGGGVGQSLEGEVRTTLARVPHRPRHGTQAGLDDHLSSVGILR